jgi:SAM-dependent methyltransferase
MTESEPARTEPLSGTGAGTTMGPSRKEAVVPTDVAPLDSWAGGDRYENYVGRWSRQVARQFVSRLGVADGSRWLDVGCGTGALTSAVLELCAPAEVIGVDPSSDFLARARATVRDPRASFQEGDALHLPVDVAAFDAAASGLVLNFVPDPSGALAEMMRVTRIGGVVAAYVWDYAEGMQLMRHFWDAAVACDAAAGAHDEGTRFPLCRPGPLEDLFAGSGLHEVVVEPLDLPTVFRDFDDYWAPFLGGAGPAPAYAASLTQRGLDDLREEVRAHLPTGPDGSIRLSARVWSVRGSVPHGGT